MIHLRKLVLALVVSVTALFAVVPEAGAAVPPSVFASSPCAQAIRQVWPVELHSWAFYVSNRESGGSPTAKNSRSSASGCFQLLAMHAPKFAAHGWSWQSDRFDPVKNTTIAFEMYRVSGASPWKQTAPRSKSHYPKRKHLTKRPARH